VLGWLGWVLGWMQGHFLHAVKQDSKHDWGQRTDFELEHVPQHDLVHMRC
jgi:hypothetical protein